MDTIGLGARGDERTGQCRRNWARPGVFGHRPRCGRLRRRRGVSDRNANDRQPARKPRRDLQPFRRNVSIAPGTTRRQCRGSFKRAPEPAISYSLGPERLSIADYLKRNPATGLLIAKDDTILYEHYQYARTDRDRFLSQSMAKTITAMLVGIAVSEGKIGSIDDTVSTYVPGLAGKEYGKTSIRDLLHMASGVAFSEVYDGHDDVAQLGARPVRSSPERILRSSVAQFNTRAAPSGTKWHYASVETEILGLVLRSATRCAGCRLLPRQDLGRHRRRGRRVVVHRWRRARDHFLLRQRNLEGLRAAGSVACA